MISWAHLRELKHSSGPILVQTMRAFICPPPPGLTLETHLAPPGGGKCVQVLIQGMGGGGGGGVKEGGGIEWIGDGMRNVGLCRDISDVTTLRRTSKYHVCLLDPGFQDFSNRVFVCMWGEGGGGGWGCVVQLTTPTVAPKYGTPSHFFSRHPQFLL